MINHKTKYKYNYSELQRELIYIKTTLAMLADDLKGSPKKLLQRLVKDIDSKLSETTRNLKNNEAASK
jgi:hypothetical protein